jgi:predicted alpha/beta-fold hydrolase
MNARGCCDSELKVFRVHVWIPSLAHSPTIQTTRYFNCGYTGDLRAVVCHIKDRYPRAPLIAGAFSLGANILTKYVGEEGRWGFHTMFLVLSDVGASCVLDAAITMANPFDWTVIDVGAALDYH